MRGEDFPLSKKKKPSLETPPRAWGRPLVHLAEEGGWGNTPTCVGKTAMIQIQKIHDEKHPHVRGEDHAKRDDLLPVIETPPRAWGRHISHFSVISFLRNTPTCVGKTQINALLDRFNEKHPHVRGEDTNIL